MDFFEQIGKKISIAGQNVAQQTKNFADVSQLNSAISEKQKKISQLFLSIGQTYYEMHKDDPSSEHREIMTEISTLYSEIAQNQEKIKQIKGVVKCPQCGADVPVNASFCNACGARIKQECTVDVKNEIQNYCPVCHAVTESDDLYCNNCGAKIEKS